MNIEKVADGIYTLKPSPGSVGSTPLSGLGGGRSNGLSVGGRLFGIRGPLFCEVVDGVSIVRGTLASTQGICAMTSCLPPNGDGQILIVGPNDNEGYVFELATNTFTAGPTGFVGGRGQVAFLGGRAYAIKGGTGQFQASGLYDFLNWAGDAFGTAEFDSDELVAIDTDGNYLILFGTKTTEVWVQTNSLPLPVNPTSNTSKIGILSPHAHCVYNDTFYWLGGNVEGNGVFYRMRGTGIPEPFSDYSISRNVAQIQDSADAVMYSYQSLGHPFILTTFFTGNKTFVYDIRETEWHMRGQRLVPSGQEWALPWLGMVTHNGSLYALNRNGRFYTIRDDVYTDDGAPIVRRRILSVIPKEASWKSYYKSIELFGEMGIASVNQEVPIWTSTSPNPATENTEFIENMTAFCNEVNAALLPMPNPMTDLVDFMDWMEVLLTYVQTVFPGVYETTSPNPATENTEFLVNTDNMLQSVSNVLYPPYVDQKVMLSISRDRGKTFGTEMWRQMSGNSSYVCRARWTGLGSAFGFVLKFQISTNCYLSWRGVRVEAE